MTTATGLLPVLRTRRQAPFTPEGAGGGGGGGLHRVHRVALLRSGAASCTSPASLSPSSQAL